MVADAFAGQLQAGYDIRPTIAITRARLTIPELTDRMRAGALAPDGRILMPPGEVAVTKVAIEPVWCLRGVAARCGIGESALRRSLFEQTDRKSVVWGKSVSGSV